MTTTTNICAYYCSAYLYMRWAFLPVEIFFENEYLELWCLEFVFLEGLLWWEPQPRELLCL